ncbi:CGNR zinc finger domain-containing protein [Streptomyces sp. NBC_00370]|uniref:CGNR zinc finger domain-containing protein n=1 Tax=Streptomyces sp. NBC_00370 TaxID=2975728 RepID=UPI002E265C32
MTIGPSVDEMQAAGFPMGGEPAVALDLVDTLMTAVTPPVDLLAAPGAHDTWWRLQLRRLPPGPPPEPAATRRLRTAIRDVFDAHLEQRSAAAVSVDDINAATAAAPVSPRLVMTGDGPRGEARWHTEYGGNAALAAVAAEAVELVADPARSALLRRCANPACSMLFLAENKRRKWCSSNVCGNRVRVARHYARGHAAGTSTEI